MGACSSCGTPVKPGDRFCNACGAPVSRPNPRGPAPGYGAPSPGSPGGAPMPAPGGAGYAPQPSPPGYTPEAGPPAYTPRPLTFARCQQGHEIVQGTSYCALGHPIALDQMQFASEAYDQPTPY